MAVPKRRQSRARTKKRRSSKKVKVPGLSICPQCKEAKMPHRLCLVCGYYGEKEIIKKEEESKK